MTLDVGGTTRHLDGDEPADIVCAADILRAGGLVAIPTETVYGLGADASNDEAVARIAPLFGRADAPASMMAARAAAPLEPTETTAASCAALASELLHELRALGGDPPP